MPFHRSRPPVAAVATATAALCFTLTACGSQTSVPITKGSPLSDASVGHVSTPTTLVDAKKTKTYGIGLAAQASVMSDLQSVSHAYCQDKGQTSNCPPTHPGMRNASFTYKKTLHGKDGTFSVAQSATSALGSFVYANGANANSTDQTGAVEGAGGSVSFAWTDTLHVTSKTLPKGSPVTISVALTVTPSGTNVDCSATLVQGGLTFLGPGSDGVSNTLAVDGACENGTFVYTLDQVGGQQGTVDQGTIAAAVGDSVGLSGTGYVNDVVCGSFGGTCVGDFGSALSGSVTWKITGITAGASYHTDSGTSYN